MSNELTLVIKNGPRELNLCDNIFFRRRSLSNPPIFFDFLQALRENKTIERIVWRPRFSNNLTPDQRLDVYRAIGEMESLVELDIAAPLTEASPIGIACMAPNLKKLKINTTMSLRYDASAQEGLIQALRDRADHLEDFECLFASNTEESLDPLLTALSRTCQSLKRVHITTTHPVTGEALSQLLSGSSSLVDLHFATVLPRDLSWDFPRMAFCMWKDLAQELRTSNLERLRLVTACDSHELTEHVIAVAEALKENTRLVQLNLESTTGFTDAACVALVEALAIHPSLEHVSVAGDDWRGSRFQLETEKSYQAFTKMLQHKTKGLTVTIGKPVDPEVCKAQRMHYRDMVVQMTLHEMGRHQLMLSSGQESWLATMDRVNGLDQVAEEGHKWAMNDENASDWELFKLECIMWLVRENPLVTKRIRERRKESLMFQMKEEYVKDVTLRKSINAPEVK